MKRNVSLFLLFRVYGRADICLRVYGYVGVCGGRGRMNTRVLGLCFYRWSQKWCRVGNATFNEMSVVVGLLESCHVMCSWYCCYCTSVSLMWVPMVYFLFAIIFVLLVVAVKFKIIPATYLFGFDICWKIVAKKEKNCTKHVCNCPRLCWCVIFCELT